MVKDQEGLWISLTFWFSREVYTQSQKKCTMESCISFGEKCRCWTLQCTSFQQCSCEQWVKNPIPNCSRFSYDTQMFESIWNNEALSQESWKRKRHFFCVRVHFSEAGFIHDLDNGSCDNIQNYKSLPQFRVVLQGYFFHSIHV